MSSSQKLRTVILRVLLCLVGIGSVILSLTGAEPALAAPRADLIPDWRFHEASGDSADSSGAAAPTEQTGSGAAAATLVAQWNLDAGSGTQLYDEVSGSKGGAIVGARWSPFCAAPIGPRRESEF